MRERSGLVVVVTSVALFIGCGGSGGERGGHEGSLTGLGPDGGVCTKDEQTIKNVMLAPTACNATLPCPCGTFCSSQTGGNCVADCYDDSWCAVGYKCSGYGQCLAAVDGGTADGSPPPPADPSCPRDLTLLNSLATMQRPCQFDDMCPQGSFCNHVKEVCDVSCKMDSECASMNTAGHTFVCGCLGQCAEVAAPVVRPTTTLPTLQVSTGQFSFNRPATITAPNWGSNPTRAVSVVAVTPFVTTGSAMGGAGGTGGAGGAGGTSGTIVGPTVTIQANPGPGLMVACPTTSGPVSFGGNGGTGGPGGAGGNGGPPTFAMPCTFSIDPKTFTKVGDVYRSAPYVVTVAPSTAASFATATSWNLRLESKDIANAPRVVNLRYLDAAIPTGAAPATPVTTLDPNFLGVGQVDITTPTKAVLHIQVKARVVNNRLTLFDETLQLSPSGKLVLFASSNPVDWQAFIDATGDSDQPLQQTFSGGLIQRINAAPVINADPAGNLAGSFTKSIFTDYVFDQPASGTPASPFDTELAATFSLRKATAAQVAACTTATDCTGGARCDLGFCTNGPVFHPDPTNPAARPPATKFVHRRMLSWSRHYAEDTSGISGARAVYIPNSFYVDQVLFSGNTVPVPVISGEPNMLLQYPPGSILGAFPPADVPLITQHDSTGWSPPASTLLRSCVTELSRERTHAVSGGGAIGSSQDTELYDQFATCINLGRTAYAMNDMITFQRTLQKWLEVHSFVLREGLEEVLLDRVTTAIGTPAADANGPPPPLEELLSIGESGLGLALDTSSYASNVGFALLDPNTIWASDYRSIFTPCTTDADCSFGGAKTSVCQFGACTQPTMVDFPQQEQPVGAAPKMLEAATSYLKVLEAYLSQIGRQTYGQASANTPSSSRTTAVARYGLGMRLVLAVEQLAAGIKVKAGPCPAAGRTDTWDPANCPFAADRYNVALNEMNAVRRRVVQAGEALRLSSNPFGIIEDDVPLFFGDPVGENSRYFAASDYLLDGWAVPAVAEAQSSLDSARGAWIAKMQAAAQDELNQHNRQQEIDTLMTKYGSFVLEACGNEAVPDSDSPGGIRYLESTEVIPYYAAGASQFNSDSCYIDPSCIDKFALGDERRSLEIMINSLFLDASGAFLPSGGDEPWWTRDNYANLVTRSEMCKLGTFKYLPNDQFLAQLRVVCPLETTGSGNPCEVVKSAAAGDNNLYFRQQRVAVPMLPVAALYGPIRKRDIGIDGGGFYNNVPAPGDASNGIKWATGPDDDIYNFRDYRSDPFVLNPSSPLAPQGRPIAQNFVEIAIPACSDAGKQPTGWWHLSRDYPLPRAEVPATCYRGQLGVAMSEIRGNVLRLQRAKEVLDNGKKGLEDAFSLCRNIDTHAKMLMIVQQDFDDMKHDYEVVSLFSDSLSKGISGSGGNPIAGAAVGFLNLTFGALGIVVDDEAAKLRAMEKEFSAEEKSQECWNGFRSQRRAMATAMTDIQIAAKDLDAQQTRFRNLQSDVTLNLQEGKAVYQREVGTPVANLSHHMWIDERVDRYRKEFEWARRLTFVALRAVEYEFQQTLPFRAEIASADAPTQLEDVIRELKQEQASRSINRRRPDEASLVVSLRDDVLGIADRSSEPAGERNWTPAQRFSSRLSDASFAWRDSKGNYLGQGVPFTLGPKDILETRCGERLWRVTATMQGDGIDSTMPGASVLLLKRNTFSSQYCAGKAPTVVGSDGSTTTPAMQTGVIHTSAGLFVPGASVDLSDANLYTAAQLYPWFNVRKADFYKTSFQDGASEELAGRGLYGDYVLLFPKQMLDDDFTLNRVEDVLLRLDYLSVDNLSQ